MFNDEPSSSTEYDEQAKYDDRVVTAGDFEPDVSAAEWTERIRLGDILSGPIFNAPLATLTPVHPVGIGRTNLTLIRPDIVQTDAATPHASFDRRLTPDRNPAVSVHFEPAAYGATGPGTYIFRFSVEAPTRSAFSPSGFAGGGVIDAPGSIRFDGLRTITLTMRNVPFNAQVNASITQTNGEAWNWFSTTISLPPLVFETFQG